jgi:hypothetical protein
MFQRRISFMSRLGTIRNFEPRATDGISAVSRRAGSGQQLTRQAMRVFDGSGIGAYNSLAAETARVEAAENDRVWTTLGLIGVEAAKTVKKRIAGESGQTHAPGGDAIIEWPEL